MTDIVSPKTGLPITQTEKMTRRFRDWTQLITRATNLNTIIDGTGSPEGVLSAVANTQFRDTAGPNLYWKSVDDVAGDTTMGWLLVV